jgi:hypothetical protein
VAQDQKGARAKSAWLVFFDDEHLAAAGNPPDVVAAWGDPCAAASLQLAAGLDGGCGPSMTTLLIFLKLHQTCGPPASVPEAAGTGRAHASGVRADHHVILG